MADFPFPLASFILKCAVDNISLYFLTHKIIRKNLKTKKTKFLKILRVTLYGKEVLNSDGLKYKDKMPFSSTKSTYF